MVGSSRTEKDCSSFDNDRVTLLLRPEPRNLLDMMQNGSCSIFDERFLYEKYKYRVWREEEARSPWPATDRRIYSIIWASSIWHPWGFLFDCIESPNKLRFPYRSGSFETSRSFMMKSMSFKRMVRRSCKVEPCSTRREIDLPKNTTFFKLYNSFGTLQISPIVQCFHNENCLQIKRCQMGFLLPKWILLHQYIKASLSRIVE